MPSSTPFPSNPRADHPGSPTCLPEALEKDEAPSAPSPRRGARREPRTPEFDLRLHGDVLGDHDDRPVRGDSRERIAPKSGLGRISWTDGIGESMLELGKTPGPLGVAEWMGRSPVQN